MINLLEPLGRAALYIALMLTVGLPVGLAGIVLPLFRQHGIDTRPVLASIQRILSAASLVMLAGASVLFIAQLAPLELEFSSAEEWIEFVRLSLLGQMWIVRMALGLISLIALKLIVTPAARQVGCALAGLAAQVTLTRTSHSAAMGAGWMPLAADFAHLFAGALWGGGLVALLIAVQHVLRDETHPRVETTRALIGRFSPFGIVGVALAAGTGLALSSVHIGDVDVLRTSDYGRLVLLKIVLAVGAVALAALHKFATQRRMQSQADVQRFSRTLLAEAILLVGVFAGAALLTSTAPPHQTVIHQMADGSTHVMVMTDPDFQRALQIAALAIVAAGAIAFALEWRTRLKSQARWKVQCNWRQPSRSPHRSS